MVEAPLQPLTFERRSVPSPPVGEGQDGGASAAAYPFGLNSARNALSAAGW